MGDGQVHASKDSPEARTQLDCWPHSHQLSTMNMNSDDDDDSASEGEGVAPAVGAGCAGFAADTTFR